MTKRAAKEDGDLVTIPVTALEFREGGNTLWIHGPAGGTVLRLKTLDGKITSTPCQDGTFESHGDALIKGDLKICLGTQESALEALHLRAEVARLTGVLEGMAEGRRILGKRG